MDTTASAEVVDTDDPFYAPECHACGCEADVVSYLRDAITKQRVGFVCSCRATTVHGIISGIV